MSITKQEKKVLSSDGIHELAGVVYIPEGTIKGLFHVVHGMTEYIGRYDSFMYKMAEEGYLVFGYDHLGHGKTVNDESELGFISNKNGWELLSRDVKVFADEIKKEYPNLPYYLMGHSMGSFIVRMNAALYGNPDKLIVMGTGGPNPAAGIALGLIKTIMFFCGKKHISPFIETLAFGSYNSHFKDEGDDKAWLSTKLELREKYKADPLCTFHFTCSALYDLVRLNHDVNTMKVIDKTKKELPIFFVSGSDDPVGDYGKGVQMAFENYKKNHTNVQMKLYSGNRHEILNDIAKEEVIMDILNFLKA